MEKTARKNTKYSRNETMLKIGHLAKGLGSLWAIAFPRRGFLGTVGFLTNSVSSY